MNFAVGIACLVVVAFLGEVAGTPKEHQLLEKDQSKIQDESSILQARDLELFSKSLKKKKTRLHCKILGGQCEHKKKDCHGGYGWCYEGEDFCKHHAHYCCCVPPPKEGCVFGDKSYPHKAFLKDGCIRFQCLDGEWVLKSEKKDPACYSCCGHPGLYISPFDKADYYFNNKTGWYRFTHDDNDDGVDVLLKLYPGTNESCIDCFRYTENGNVVEICPANPLDELDVAFVTVNGNPVEIATGTDDIFNFPIGASVLVHANSPSSYYLVTSDGLSVHIQSESERETTLYVWTKELPTYNNKCLCEGDPNKLRSTKKKDEVELK